MEKEHIVYGNLSVDRTYSYDALGRVTQITDSRFGGHSYTYDYRGFLTRANSGMFKFETFKYDANGNITSYNGTTFLYDGTIKDKLIRVGGNAVYYASAASLNPTSWNGRSYEYEGRRLKSFTYNGTSANYTYDDQSRRIKKVVNGYFTNYYYSGDLLVYEDGPDGNLNFLYDENGQLYGFILNKISKYFYIKDILGNILGIVNENGTIVARYSYSAFGECTITENKSNIATINPFRFKGYYYDNESGMYYCHTRYLVPEWGRWLNTDSPNFLNYDDINGMNLFAYCGNNPVMNFDPTGEVVLSLIITALVGAAVSAATSAAVQSLTTGEVNLTQVGISALFGAVTGMLSFWGIGGSLGQFFIQGTLGVGELYSIAALDGNAANVGIEQVVATFIFAGGLGAIGGRGGTKEFKRVAQIEKDFLKYARRDICRYGKSVFTTMLKRGGKYLKDFVNPTVVNGLVSGGVTAIANISDYWIQKLYDEFK